ncbi:MAG: hypothetical protein AVDCRST_MAG02-1257, partial [uncultured Rubrobacteraceae bacterium]
GRAVHAPAPRVAGVASLARRGGGKVDLRPPRTRRDGVALQRDAPLVPPPATPGPGRAGLPHDPHPPAGRAVPHGLRSRGQRRAGAQLRGRNPKTWPRVHGVRPRRPVAAGRRRGLPGDVRRRGQAPFLRRLRGRARRPALPPRVGRVPGDYRGHRLGRRPATVSRAVRRRSVPDDRPLERRVLRAGGTYARPARAGGGLLRGPRPRPEPVRGVRPARDVRRPPGRDGAGAPVRHPKPLPGPGGGATTPRTPRPLGGKADTAGRLRDPYPGGENGPRRVLRARGGRDPGDRPRGPVDGTVATGIAAAGRKRRV